MLAPASNNNNNEHLNNVTILRQRASSLLNLQGTDPAGQEVKDQGLMGEEPHVTGIADEALREVLKVLSDDEGGGPGVPSLPSSPSAADLKRLREVKEKFGNVTVVDKEKVHDMQSELDEHKKSTSEKLETLMTSEVRDLLVKVWIEGGCVQKDTLNKSSEKLDEGMSFVRGEHSELRDAVKGNLDEFAALISESMINVNSSLTTLENERNKLVEEVEQAQHVLGEERKEREEKEAAMVEEGNGVKEDLANVSKILQAAHSDNEELGNSLKLMRAREAENRRREESDFIEELRGGFVLKKHCEGRQKIHYKSFALSPAAPHVISWNDGSKTFPLVDAVITLDEGGGKVFSMVSVEGQRLRLEAESVLKAGIFVTKLQALIL
ncbi:hypothetical protein TrLO_g13599 [Triparma laevis f. longispina]|uniref:Uncharacterized protein n=1 Tax=Triparma laevis f. longispina TaxID=1714387 RepID=A0A9W7AVQ9_9STRA|nr:hypothetical protein TrLO_g13599 [Triparma laevis f. longispina]